MTNYTTNTDPERAVSPEEAPPANPTEKILKEYGARQSEILQRRFITTEAYNLSSSEIAALDPNLKSSMSDEAAEATTLRLAENKAAILRQAYRDEEAVAFEDYVNKLNQRLDELNAAVYNLQGVTAADLVAVAGRSEEQLVAVLDTALRSGSLEAFDLALQEAEARGFDYAFAHGLDARGASDPGWYALMEEKIQCEALLGSASTVDPGERFDDIFGPAPSAFEIGEKLGSAGQPVYGGFR